MSSSHPLPKIILSLLLFAGCAKNPVTGKQELRLVSESKELHIGEENYPILQQVEGGTYLVHKEIEKYVDEVGQKLAAAGDRPQLPYHFVVINDSIPNAWSLPGGKIAIYRGLLYELESESELAAVLAHEIVHAAARHSAKQIERATLLNVGIGGLGLSLKKYRSLAMSAAGAVGALAQMKYSRHAEFEADRYGIEYMVRAGYNSQGAVSLQKKFIALSKGKKSGLFDRLFASHPPSEARLKANQEKAAEYPEGGFIGEEAYQKIMFPLLKDREAYATLDESALALEKNQFRQAESLAQSALQMQPLEPKGYFLLGQIAYSQDNFSDAIDYFTQAIAYQPNYYEYYLMRGDAYYQQRDWEAMEQDLNQSLKYLETLPAHYLLGLVALQKNHTQKAIYHFNIAQQGDTREATRAKVALAELVIPSAPEEYLKIAPTLDQKGYVNLLIENRSPISVRDVTVLVQLVNPSGSFGSVEKFTYQRVIKPQGRGMIKTGMGPFSSQAHIENNVKYKIEAAEVLNP